MIRVSRLRVFGTLSSIRIQYAATVGTCAVDDEALPSIRTSLA
jgi:hypothetical protein